MPDTYKIINDFRLEINPPLIRKNEDGRTDPILSIQIDHLIISPPGVFVIETKNWSINSQRNQNLFSPIMQLHRSNYALFKYLQDLIESGRLLTFDNNWGKQKISLNNILLMMAMKPKEEYSHVKILTLNEINRYITSLQPIFSDKQIEELSAFLFLHHGDHYWKPYRQRNFRRTYYNHYRRRF